MWFDSSLDKFQDAVKLVCETTGYDAFTIPDQSHNDFIMNKVLNAIDESKFVITDLTSIPEEINKKGEFKLSVRGEVYCEAWYARGMGLPVIQMCRRDAQAKIHFDNKQINTLMWEEKDGQLFINGKVLLMN